VSQLNLWFVHLGSDLRPVFRQHISRRRLPRLWLLPGPGLEFGAPHWFVDSGLPGVRCPFGFGQLPRRGDALRAFHVRVDLLLKLRRIDLGRLWPWLEFRHHVGFDLGDARLPFRPSPTPDLRRSQLTGGLPGSTGRGLGSGLTTVNFGHDLTGGAGRRGGPLQQHRVFHPAVKKNLLELAARRQAPRQLGVPVRGGQHAARRAGGFGKPPRRVDGRLARLSRLGVRGQDRLDM
jgi:hypothetical protein